MWEVMNWAKWLVGFTHNLDDSLLELASDHGIVLLQHLWVLLQLRYKAIQTFATKCKTVW